MYTPEHSPLGKKSAYIDHYDAALLYPIPRVGKRTEIGIDDNHPPFIGADIWNGYEISFLNRKGKPIVAVGQFIIPCSSKNIIESKSFKLYLNSFNNTKFDSLDKVKEIIAFDLSEATQIDVTVRLIPVDELQFDANAVIGKLPGNSLDYLDIECENFEVCPNILQLESKEIVHEVLTSNLLKSNCLVTGQPDWGSVSIEYKGPKINHESLLLYIVSFRNHNEFHEQCVERIFADISRLATFAELTVDARYTRRGGLDICPFRSTIIDRPKFTARLHRQ